MTSANHHYSQLVIAGFIGGLVAVGAMLMITPTASTQAAQSVARPEAVSEFDFGLIHQDLEQIIALAKLGRHGTDSKPTPSAREVVPSKELPEGLVPAIEALERTLRELLARPVAAAEGRTLHSLRAAGPRPANRQAQRALHEELQTDENSVLDRYFGASISEIYSEYGRPDHTSVSESGVYWQYQDSSGERQRVSFRFTDGAVYGVYD